MKVGFCISVLTSGHNTRGIGTYSRNLLEALIKEGVEVKEFSNIKEIKDVDVLHFPYFDLFARTLPFRSIYPMVVTIHDVIPLSFPEHYPPGIKGLINTFLQKLALKNVLAIITDSEASKREIIKVLGVSPQKVHCVPLAPAPHFQKINDQGSMEKVKKKYKLPDKFALYTGNVNWNKNLLNLSEASLKAETDLVLVGKSFEEKNNLDHPEMESFKEFLKLYLNNPKVHILGFVGDEDLVVVTNLASVALLPSFAEGFGLPILEAQICGVPVITSSISSMPEVVGKGALLVDPNSVENITQAISKIMKEREFRENLVIEGFNNVKRFSWKKVAQETIKVYAKVLHS